MSDVATHPAIVAHYPVLAQAAAHIAGPTHRNMGTVGGNLCLDTRCIFYNQSEWWRDANNHCLKTTGTMCHVAPKSRGVCFATFAGDLAPALLTLNAEVDIAGPAGKRTIPLNKLYIGFARQDVPVTETQGDGKYYLSLRPGEIVTAVRAKNTPGLRSAYDKIRIRKSIEYPVAGVAVALKRDGDTLAELRVAFTGTNPRPVLLEGTARIVRRPARRARHQRPRRAGARPDHADEDHLHARSLPPPRGRRAGAAAADAIVRKLTVGAGVDEFTERRPYNAVSDFVDANVARGLGSKIAFIDPERSLTYGELQARSIRFAHALRALGIRQEERVALLLHDTVDYPVAFWGTIRAGNIAIPLNTFLTRRAIRLYPRRFPRIALVADAPLAQAIWPVIERLPHLRTVILVGADDVDKRLCRPRCALFRGRHRRRRVMRRSPPTPCRTRWPSGSTPPARPAIRRASSTSTPI